MDHVPAYHQVKKKAKREINTNTLPEKWKKKNNNYGT